MISPKRDVESGRVEPADGEDNDYMPTIGNAETSKAHGFIDGVWSGRVQGWAKYRSSDCPVPIQVQLDGKIVAENYADNYRKDLEDNEIGNGRHAFDVDLSKHFSAYERHQIDILDKNSRTSILSAPYLFTATPADCWQARRGRLEGLRNGYLTGWAVDLDCPGRSVRLILRINEDVRYAFDTHVFRYDLETSGIGRGPYGFSVPVPNETMHSVPIPLSVEFADTGVQIEGNPIWYFNPGGIMEKIDKMESRITDLESTIEYLMYINKHSKQNSALTARFKALLSGKR